MRQRLWWHHIQRDKNLPQQAVQKIDFDDAQIMWTQWRKIKCYDHMTTVHKFRENFKDVLKMIADGKISIVSQPATTDAKGKAERKEEKIMKIYCQTSPKKPKQVSSKPGSVNHPGHVIPEDQNIKLPQINTQKEYQENYSDEEFEKQDPVTPKKSKEKKESNDQVLIPEHSIKAKLEACKKAM